MNNSKESDSDSSLSDSEEEEVGTTENTQYKSDFNFHRAKQHWHISTQQEACNHQRLINILREATNSETQINCLLQLNKRDLLLLSRIVRAAGHCAFVNDETIHSKSKLEYLQQNRNRFNISINGNKKVLELRGQLMNLSKQNHGKLFNAAMNAFRYK